MTGPRRRLGFEARLLLTVVAALLPPFVTLWLYLLLAAAPEIWQLAALILLPLSASVLLVLLLRRLVVYPLRTVATLLEALRQGDFSFRGARAEAGDALGDVVLELNQLADTLRENRLKTEETLALLKRVLDSIDIAIFAFDDGGRLRLINPAGARLLGQTEAQALCCPAIDLGLGDLLEGDSTRTLELQLKGQGGRFELRRGTFRESGAPQTLLVLTDLSRALREEERTAFKRLIRVLGHELNNSLAPIKSMAATLSTLLGRDPLPADWRDDARQVLDVISDRSDALARFLSAYSQLARLPAPTLRPCALKPLLERVARLETRLPVQLDLAAAELTLRCDPDQLEQALINLIKNATEASQSQQHDLVRLKVERSDDVQRVQILIDDLGPGLARTDNLFVPFFTTKPGGSGVGLVLARQVIEAHGGTLTLRNREDVPHGCRVEVGLPCSL